ncbi:putative cyclin-D7-1 G1/S-specific cyclin-D7-1 [Vigna angularis]|uniref:B-like cyclin n=3 Tax=Phaseolus angularis TaxID=3914 RepID=A0A8T0JRM5_PHAAN|nr:putative cyclin-D7-1 isoform X2 [Vigna angularis]KAG2380888.1 putative cyclin-D7-1 G1/S-specific cyclin-D7-1 [Vigna angularis]
MVCECMDNLLCDEVWLSNSENTFEEEVGDFVSLKSYENKEFEEAFALYLEKEASSLPEQDYAKYLHSNSLFVSRCRVIQWLVKCGSHFNLSFGTVFLAVNYLDRFVSICQSNDWKYWMLELLSVSCLSVAIKFNEKSELSMNEIQVEGLNYSFQSSVILKMELILLKALGWHLNSVTSYSFVEIVDNDFLESHLYQKLISPATQLLLQATLDQKMLEFRPSIIGISALWCTLQHLFPQTSDTYIAYIMRLLNQSQKDDIIKCHELMQRQTSFWCENQRHCPLSPTTVLLNTSTRIYDG